MDDMTGLSHARLLDRLAEVAVRVGLGGLNPGQQLVMTAPLEAVALARRITEHAYRAGASLVTTFFADDAASLLRYRHAPDAGFDTAAGWLYEGMAAAFRDGAARLAILGDDPNLLAGQDPEKVARANRARSIAYRPALELITNSAINWTIVACATPAWARAVFPALPEAEAVDRRPAAVVASRSIRVSADIMLGQTALQTRGQREDLAGRFSRHPGLDHLKGIGRPWRMNLAPIVTTVRLPRTQRTPLP